MQSEEEDPEEDERESKRRSREARPVPAMVPEPSRRAGPEEEQRFDLRGVIADRQARAGEERSGHSGEEWSGHEVEEDWPDTEYCFDPKCPLADPYYPADQQVGQVSLVPSTR